MIRKKRQRIFGDEENETLQNVRQKQQVIGDAEKETATNGGTGEKTAKNKKKIVN